MKIVLEFECTASDGVCVWSKDLHKCIEMNGSEESFICPYLEARRKLEVE